jgi:superfamily I DNA/RNA helicase
MKGVELNEIAVLYRAHYHAVELQLEFSRRGIPYQITSGIRFFEQAHIKDVASFIRFVANPRDEVAFKRMVRLLPGIGGKIAENLWNGWEKSLDSVPVAAVAERGPGPTTPATEAGRGRRPRLQHWRTLAQIKRQHALQKNVGATCANAGRDRSQRKAESAKCDDRVGG